MCNDWFEEDSGIKIVFVFVMFVRVEEIFFGKVNFYFKEFEVVFV